MPILTFIFLILYCENLSLPGSLHFATVIWNVGQGSWATKMTDRECQHFDVGGEHASLQKIFQFCQGKTQSILISHWDQDHISHLKSFLRLAQKPCLDRPLSNPTKGKQKLLQTLQKFQACPKRLSFFPLERDQQLLKKSNDESQIFLSDGILFPGDSPARLEKIWMHRIGQFEPRVLILGHHGSKTSTSLELLDRFSEIKMAIASARFKRYGHPHPLTKQKLRLKKIPILLTEEWGNIWFLNK